MTTRHLSIGICSSATVLIFLTCAVAAQQPQRDATKAQTPIGTASVVGTVTGDSDRRPIRRVTVTLSAVTTGLSVQRVAVTDDEGRFSFVGLPAGSYNAPRAARLGYVGATYGEKRPGGIGTPITLAEGQRLTVNFKMLRGGVITGTLTDQMGRAMPQTSVQVTEVRVVNGERTPTGFSGNSVTTDDRGMYRIFGLAPADYVVAASPRFATSGEVRPITEAEIRWAQQQLRPAGAASTTAMPEIIAPRPAQAVAYTQVYYPGTTDPARATTVTVVAGQERGGVDFTIQFVSTARIEGTVEDQNGQPPQTAQLNLVPKLDNSAAMVDTLFFFESMILMRPTVTNGKFSMTGVRPGDYTLTARAAPASAGGAGAPGAGPGGRGGPPQPLTLWAMTDVTVDGNDLSGITLHLQPGMTLSGRVVFDGTVLQPPTDFSRISVRLSAAPTPGVTVSTGGATAVVSADGTFKMPGVTPGRYLVSASAPAATPVAGTPWVMRSAIVGGVDIADVALEVKPDQDVAGLVISFTDKSGELSGTLLDAAGHSTSAFSVMLFTTDKSQWSSRSRRLKYPIRTNTDGKYKFSNVLPGEYYLAALSDFDQNDVDKAWFLEQVAAAAIKITVTEGEKKAQDLKVGGS